MKGMDEHEKQKTLTIRISVSGLGAYNVRYYGLGS